MIKIRYGRFFCCLQKGNCMSDESVALKMNVVSEKPKEGDLYRVIELYGKTFEIRYGYYEEIDRQYDPMEIYPDFLQNPVYTKDGYPFVTLMQGACRYFQKKSKDPERDCENCKYMERGEELIALCRCPQNKKSVKQNQT